jgi:hypothetical protein
MIFRSPLCLGACLLKPPRCVCRPLLKQGFETRRHFQSPRINATVARKSEPSFAGFYEKALPDSGFCWIFGQGFELRKQQQKSENEKDHRDPDC